MPKRNAVHPAQNPPRPVPNWPRPHALPSYFARTCESRDERRSRGEMTSARSHGPCACAPHDAPVFRGRRHRCRAPSAAWALKKRALARAPPFEEPIFRQPLSRQPSSWTPGQTPGQTSRQTPGQTPPGLRRVERRPSTPRPLWRRARPRPARQRKDRPSCRDRRLQQGQYTRGCSESSS